jgi:hypothetical protein
VGASHPELGDEIVVSIALGRRDQERLARLTDLLGCSEGDVLVNGLDLLDTVAAHIAAGGQVYRVSWREWRIAKLLLFLPDASLAGRGVDEHEQGQEREGR